MRIARHMFIAGVPAISLRDALKQMGDGDWRPASLAARLDLTEAEGKRLCSQLAADGLLTGRDWSGEQLYSLATQGNALALASAARPISRAKAEELVAALIQRARMINADSAYVFGVNQIIAFGSYVASSPDLGDVDVAVELYPKHSDPTAQQAACQKYTDDAQNAGRRFRSTFDLIVAPRTDVFSVLKNKSKYISIHEAAELDDLPGVITKVIFSADTPGAGGS